MGLTQRPFAGSIPLNRETVKHTPDALVFFNNSLQIAGCQGCNGLIDLQQYITTVSADPSTEGPATATIAMHVPKQMADALYRDGQFVLGAGVEVHIYFRGYIPVQGMFAEITAEEMGGVDVANMQMYPYYQVFHGVTTEVSTEYANGEHMATLSCTDLLHFWQYQRMSTNGAASAEAVRPTNSNVSMSYVGHNFTGMTPYAVIYTLYRDVMGAAGGVEFALGNETNVAANSEVAGTSLWSMAQRYWQKRFSQTMTSLRMYGLDGTLYNGFQAAFLGRLSAQDVESLVRRRMDPSAQSNENDPLTNPDLLAQAREVGFDVTTLLGSPLSDGVNGGSTASFNAAQLQPFAWDVAKQGDLSLFESQYETKMEIAGTVKEITGFEFYMDVDGDLVFKPPFFNLDTSSSPFYRIEPIDVISFQAGEKEPEATVVKITGSHWANQKVGVEGEWGTRAEFIDYRLVAQYGWRQQTVETSYLADPRSMFFSAISRMDLFNIGIQHATCTIPLRPELRPGYPVYFTGLDCFYYVQSISHSFSFGGQCTSTLNLVGRRTKFFGPGRAPKDGSPAGIQAIDLANPHLPVLPLQVLGQEGIPRFQGFPNVVLSLDTERINPMVFATAVNVDDLQTPEAIRGLVARLFASRGSPLQVADDAGQSGADPVRYGPWKLQTSNGEYIQIPVVEDLLVQAQRLKSATDTRDVATIASVQEEVQALTALVALSRSSSESAFPGGLSASTVLSLLADKKASFNVGSSLPGYYRYYSSSHPDPQQQGPLALVVDPVSGVASTGGLYTVSEQFAGTTLGFSQNKDEYGYNQLVSLPVSAGIPLRSNSGAGVLVVTPTHEIHQLEVAEYEVDQKGPINVLVGDRATGYPEAPLSTSYQTWFFAQMQGGVATPDTPLSEFQGLFDEWGNVIGDATGYYPAYPVSGVLGDLCQGSTEVALRVLARTLGDALAYTAAKGISDLEAGREAEILAQGDNAPVVEAGSTPRENYPDVDLGPPAGTGVAWSKGRKLGTIELYSVGGSDTASKATAIAFARMRTAAQQQGITLAVVSGFRSFQEQEVLYQKFLDGSGNKAAKPGYSNHQNGIALDMQDAAPVIAWLRANAKSFGFVETVEGEPWHWEFAGTTQATPTLVRRTSSRSVDQNLDALYEEMAQTWISFFPNAGDAVMPNSNRVRSRERIRKMSFPVPVLPVSDERGYSVVGTFSYGRGLSIEPGGSFDRLLKSALTTTDPEQVDAFLSTIRNRTDVSKAVGTLDLEHRALLAATANGSAARVAAPIQGGDMVQNQFSNRVASIQQGVGKTTVVNAAYSLADLGQTFNKSQVCACKGAEADILLEAFNTANLVAFDRGQVQQWLQDQALEKADAWSAGRQAMAGTAFDARASTVTDAVGSLLDNYADLFSKG